MRLDEKYKFEKYTRAQLLALLTFADLFDELKPVNTFDCTAKLVKVNMKELHKRLKKKWADEKKVYTFSIPANEAISLCIAAQTLGLCMGHYENVILFKAVNSIQEFYT